MAGTYSMIHISTLHYLRIGVGSIPFSFDGTNITVLHIVTPEFICIRLVVFKEN